LEVRVLHPSVAQHLVGEIVHVFENEQPATSLVGSGGCPGPTRHAELKCLARKSQSIVPASRQGMMKIDDLLQSWAKLVLTVVARLAHGSPRQRISPSKES
jgi:hypothetical protein